MRRKGFYWSQAANFLVLWVGSFIGLSVTTDLWPSPNLIALFVSSLLLVWFIISVRKATIQANRYSLFSVGLILGYASHQLFGPGIITEWVGGWSWLGVLHNPASNALLFGLLIEKARGQAKNTALQAENIGREEKVIFNS